MFVPEWGYYVVKYGDTVKSFFTLCTNGCVAASDGCAAASEKSNRQKKVGLKETLALPNMQSIPYGPHLLEILKNYK